MFHNVQARSGNVGNLEQLAQRNANNTNTPNNNSSHFNECSFAPETSVATPDGEIPIGEIEVGDIVLAYNEETGEIGEYPVTAVWSHDDDNILTLTINGEVIITTTDHPFYTDSGEWILAGDLQIGDAVVSADGDFGTVDAVVSTDGTAEVYNLTVDEAHTYFVGDGAWLVHNSCPLPLPSNYKPVDPKIPELYEIVGEDRFSIRLNDGTERITPNGWQIRNADNNNGYVIQKPNPNKLNKDADSIRVMYPTGRYPQGYVRYHNRHGQPLDIVGNNRFNTSQDAMNQTHIPIPNIGDIVGDKKGGFYK